MKDQDEKYHQLLEKYQHVKIPFKKIQEEFTKAHVENVTNHACFKYDEDARDLVKEILIEVEKRLIKYARYEKEKGIKTIIE